MKTDESTALVELPVNVINRFKNHALAAFFLSSAIASTLLLIFYSIGTFNSSVSLTSLSSYGNQAFRVDLPVGMELFSTEGGWLFVDEANPTYSPVVINVDRQTLVDIIGQPSFVQDQIASNIYVKLPELLDTGLQNQGFTIKESSVSDFSHAKFRYGQKYVADTVNADNQPVTVVTYVLFDTNGLIYSLNIASVLDLKPSNTNKADVIANSFEVKS